MADNLYIQGNVRQTVAPNLPAGVMLQPNINNRADLLFAQALPPLTEIVRLGRSWDVRIASGSAFTFVAALPTTRAELVLYNGEGAGGPSYVIDSVYCLAISSMAAAGSISLLAQIVETASAPTDDAAQLITSRSGKTGYSGRARRAVAQTTMTANKWSLLETSISGGSATAQIGLAAYARVNGGLIIPPGAMLGVNTVAGTAVGTAVMGVVWHEVQLDLG